MKTVEAEFESGRHRCYRLRRRGSRKSKVVRCEELVDFVEEHRGIVVSMAELTADDWV